MDQRTVIERARRENAALPKHVRTVGIVSLSSGVLGEDFVRHEVELGLKRLETDGLRVKLLPHAMDGMTFLREHPEKRAEDLLTAFQDPEIDMILCAIGGDDTYRLAPYLFEDDRLKKAVTKKVFLGFSDTTIDHFMLRRVGLNTFYGQAFLPDICEMDREMLPYTRRYWKELITAGTIREITPSDVWYENRTDFGPDRLGTALPVHPNEGFQLLQGSPCFSGEILGGCIDSIFDMFDGGRYPDMPAVCRKYGLFPSAEEWRGKLLLLESSEELMPPEKYRKALEYLKAAGVLDAVSGILVGKPMDEMYHEDYKRVLTETVDDPALPILCNVSVGHALPRCIIPFGVRATVDARMQTIRF